MFDFWVPLGPSVRVPGLFGARIIYPMWLVVLQGLALALALVLHEAGKEVWLVRHKFIRNQSSGGDGATRRSTAGRPRNSIEYLRECHESQLQWLRSEKRRLRASAIEPVKGQVMFLGLPTLAGLTLSEIGPATLGPLLVASAIFWTLAESWSKPLFALPQFTVGLVVLWLWVLGLWWVGILLHLLVAGTLAVWRYAGVQWNRIRTSVTVGEVFWVTGIERDPPGNRGFTRTRTLDGIELFVPGLDVGESARVIVASNSHGEPLAYPADGPLEPLTRDDHQSLGNGNGSVHSG